MTRARAIAVVVALGVVLAAAESAGDEEAFTAALRRAKTGDPAGAIAELRTLAERAPDDPFADDALAEAARIADEALGDPAQALDLYQRLAVSYPGSRLARRAERRARELEAGMGEGGEFAEALAAYRAVLREDGAGSRGRAIERVAEILARTPGFPLAVEARLWLGEACRDEGRWDDSLAWYRAAAELARAPLPAGRARLGQAAVHLARGDLDAAEAIDRVLAGASSSALAIPAQQGLRKVSLARTRATRAAAAWLVLGGLLLALLAELRVALGGWPAVARALARPPGEVLYAAPVAAVLAGVAQSGFPPVGRAVLLALAGALAVTWLSGAGLDGVRARGPVGWTRVLTHATGAAVAVLAFLYIALERAQLLDMILETWRHGPER